MRDGWAVIKYVPLSTSARFIAHELVIYQFIVGLRLCVSPAMVVSEGEAARVFKMRSSFSNLLTGINCGTAAQLALITAVVGEN